MDTDRRSLRDRLLDAAAELITLSGYRSVRVQDVADAAGVSRQTVYNEFGDKWGMARALVMRDNERYLDGIDAVLSAHTDIHTAVEAAVTFTLRMSADDPITKAVLTGVGGDELLPLLTTQAEPVLFGAKARIIEHALRHWPDLDRTAMTEITDMAVRLTMSHSVLPGEPPEIVGGLIARMVARYLGEPAVPSAQPPPAPPGPSPSPV